MISSANIWLLHLNPLKCDGIVISNPILPPYYLDSFIISYHSVVRYLGVLVNLELNLNEHCKYISAKATCSLNFLRHCSYNAPTSIKSSAYRCIVRPILEYACPIWHPHTAKNIDALESVQRRAARWAFSSRWIPSSYCWGKCSDECISELKWPTIQRHIYFSICHIHDSLHHQNSLPFYKHFELSHTSARSHPYPFGLLHLRSILLLFVLC